MRSARRDEYEVPGFRPMNKRIRLFARESKSGIGRWEYAEGGA